MDKNIRDYAHRPYTANRDTHVILDPVMFADHNYPVVDESDKEHSVPRITIPGFLTDDHCETLWLVRVIKAQDTFRMQQRAQVMQRIYCTLIFQVRDIPSHYFAAAQSFQHTTEGRPAIHSDAKAILYLTPLAMAVYFRRIQVVKFLCRGVDEQRQVALVDPHCMNYVAPTRYHGRFTANTWLNLPIMMLVILKEFFEAIPYLLEAGHSVLDGVILHEKRRYLRRTVYVRDVIDYALIVMDMRPTFALHKLIGTICQACPQIVYMKNLSFYQKEICYKPGRTEQLKAGKLPEDLDQFVNFLSIPRRLLRYAYYRDIKCAASTQIALTVDVFTKFNYFFHATFVDLHYSRRMQILCEFLETDGGILINEDEVRHANKPPDDDDKVNGMNAERRTSDDKVMNAERRTSDDAERHSDSELIRIRKATKTSTCDSDHDQVNGVAATETEGMKMYDNNSSIQEIKNENGEQETTEQVPSTLQDSSVPVDTDCSTDPQASSITKENTESKDQMANDVTHIILDQDNCVALGLGVLSRLENLHRTYPLEFAKPLLRVLFQTGWIAAFICETDNILIEYFSSLMEGVSILPITVRNIRRLAKTFYVEDTDRRIMVCNAYVSRLMASIRSDGTFDLKPKKPYHVDQDGLTSYSPADPNAAQYAHQLSKSTSYEAQTAPRYPIRNSTPSTTAMD